MQCRLLCGRWGLIPAYAGSTPHTIGGSMDSTAHPRLRGEHVEAGMDKDRIRGSSPLTRGARTPPRSPGKHGRLIPAYAGSTRAASLPWRGMSAHPRLRGEHYPDDYRRPGGGGSSPLTRGALTLSWFVFTRLRLIPAYAGSTFNGIVAPQYEGAHPRLRGEHPHSSPATSAPRGSSPLTRGARVAGDWVDD